MLILLICEFNGSMLLSGGALNKFNMTAVSRTSYSLCVRLKTQIQVKYKYI